MSGLGLFSLFSINSHICRVLIFIFKVMMQRHNRQTSFSNYMSAVAVVDTSVVLTGNFDLL